jgi:hypothetical protein
MKLHTWLAENGKSVTWLAQQTSLSVSYVSRLVERDGVAEKTPSMETCAKIAQATDGRVTANDFVPAGKMRSRKRIPKKRETRGAAVAA